MSNKENELKYERHRGCLPESAGHHPEKKIGDEESNCAPLKRYHEGFHEALFHFSMMSAMGAKHNSRSCVQNI